MAGWTGYAWLARVDERMAAQQAVVEQLQTDVRAAEVALAESEMRTGAQIATCLQRMNELLLPLPQPQASQPPPTRPAPRVLQLDNVLGPVPMPLLTHSPQLVPCRRASTPLCQHHCVCNVTAETYVEIQTIEVANATKVKRLDDLWPWTSHLTSTVLAYQCGLAEKLNDLFTRHLARFDIMYCKAQGNRMMLVQCKMCGQGLYCKYPRGSDVDETNTVAAVAAFVGVELDSRVTQS